MTNLKKQLTTAERDTLLDILQARFAQNMERHPGLTWEAMHEKLLNSPAKLSSLYAMEMSGGEPDVIIFPGPQTQSGSFTDCVPETPSGRRNVCYDNEALAARKTHKPAASALGMAADMGISILTEAQYCYLQTLGEFDVKTSSWIDTPEDIRMRGGALFADRRYGHVFVYHNGAESYYASRGFRGVLWL